MKQEVYVIFNIFIRFHGVPRIGIINDYGVFERISQINIDYKWNVYIRINARIRVLVHINLINTDIYLLNVNSLSYIVRRWLGGWVVGGI
jgi:hypothetical protein